MSVDVLKGTERDAVDLGRMLGEWRQGTFRRIAGQVVDEPRRSRTFRWGYGCLLRPLSRRAVAPAWEMEVDTESYILDVVMLGTPTAFTVTTEIPLVVDGRTIQIPANATADEFQQLTGVTGTVSLGATTIVENDAEVLASPVRWRIAWPSEEEAETVRAGGRGDGWFVEVAQENSVGTGSLIEAIQVIPTGWTTPLRTGCFISGPILDGYLHVNGAEARYWFPNGGGLYY